MPNSPRRPKEEFVAFRIPRSRFMDIDDVAKHTETGEKLGLKHMMPEPEVFAQACGRPNSLYALGLYILIEMIFQRT